MLKIFRRFILLSLIGLNTFLGIGQSFNSPYSSFGLGDLTFKGFGRNRAMGGISIAMKNGRYIDYLNPASYAARDSLSLLFEFGGVGQISHVSTGDGSNVPWDINFSHMAFSFPITRKLSFGAGIVPYTLSNYNFLYEVNYGDELYNPEVGRLEYLFKGEGGLNEVFFGGAYEITKNFSFGINGRYIFGNITKIQSVTLVENPDAYHTKIEEQDIFGGLNISFGLQYEGHFGKDWEVVAGGFYTPKSKINKKTELLATNNLFLENGTSIDTLKFDITDKNKQEFPGSYGIGVVFNKADQIIFGIDYKKTLWANSNIMNLESIKNSQSILMGVEFTPSPRELRSYLKRIHYRAGGYYTNSYLEVQGNQLTDFGITFGVGLPIGRSRSSFNFAFDLGRRGSKQNNGILEKHGAITFSLLVYDIWFMKRKFD